MATLKPRRRKRRLLFAAAVILVPVVLLGGAGWFYLDYRLGQIPREHVNNLVTAKPGAPVNILLVGSDSRAFVEGNAKLARHFGSGSTVTGERSDVIIVVRLIPKTKGIEMLSIPRDSWVPIAGTDGSNKINSALDKGPGALVATIEQDFHIPINHYVEANFPGFTDIVNAIGGIHLDFPDRVKDDVTGLHIRQTGCQLVKGTTALALVRSRDLQYYSHGSWHYDVMGDFSRIRRQQAFFHAVIDQADHVFPNVFAINDFLGAATHTLTVDSNFSSSLIRSLATEYHRVTSKSLHTEVLVDTEALLGGSDILLPDWKLDGRLVHRFLATGTTATGTAHGGSTATGTAHGGSPSSSSVPTTSTTVPEITGTTSVPVIDNAKNYPEPWNPVPC